MSQKWNLQDIKPTGSSRADAHRTKPIRPKQDIARKRPEREQRTRSVSDVSSIDIIDGNSQKKRRLIISGIIVFVILGMGFLISTFLDDANVTVFPRNKNSSVQATFTAYLNPQVSELSYELLVLEANGERQVSATGEEVVSERSAGSVFIYNAFSSTPQRLIKNTRFESPDGLVFRINESVEVPGSTTGDDGTAVPGVISAEVFADGTGEQYNIGPARFTVPGLKGSDQYESIYAESTVDFLGGFEGSRFIIEETELQTAKQSLHLELRDALLIRLTEDAPADFILYDDAITFVFDTLPATEYGDKLATIKEQARLQVPIFKKSQFSTYLAQNTIVGYEGESVTIEDPNALSFTYTDSASSTEDLSLLTEIKFDLNGQTRIIWNFDESALRSDLTSLSKTALPNVLLEYPAIERAEAVVRPFWAQTFPESGDDIEILTTLESD